MENTKANKGLYIGGTVLALVLLFFMFCFRVVGVGQVGIITQFGRVKSEQESGVVFKLPYPIQHLVKMNVQVQKEQQNADAATHDLQSVSTTIAVNYHLTPDTARTVYVNVGTDYKIRVIDPVIQESVKAVTAQYDAADLIAKRPEVETKLSAYLIGRLGDRGISVDNVSIVNFGFSKQFNDSIESKQVAQQNAEKAQYDLQTAQLKAQQQQAQAATLTPEYLQLQAIERWNGQLPKNTVSGGSTLFNIPLE